jgi:penicillin-binding protein 1B
MVCAVWVGFDDNRDLRMKASDAALPMWADFIKQALDLRPDLGGDSFAKPGGIVSVEIDPTTGCLAGPDSVERRQEIFIAGTEPSSSCFQDTAEAELVPVMDEVTPPTGFPTLEADADPDHDDLTVEVDIEVCTQTGLLASPYCPRTEKRTFENGRKPRESCGLQFHGPGL